jgi:hypothetical protein
MDDPSFFHTVAAKVPDQGAVVALAMYALAHPPTTRRRRKRAIRATATPQISALAGTLEMPARDAKASSN